MKQNRIVVGIAATVACLFGASVHAELKTENAATQISDAAVTKTSAPADVDSAAAIERRTVYLKKQIERKLNRKPKRDRDAYVTKWQVAGRSAEGAAAFDQPQSAMTAFLEKRLAVGSTAIAPSDYEEALKRASKMPVYSTLEGKMISAGNPDAEGGIVARSAGNTLAKSGALASSWQALGPGNIGGRTRGLLIHPTTPNTMWAGGVAGGIWKTIDGGNSWVPKADLVVNIAVNSLILDPRNPNNLFAGTGEGFFNGDAVRGAGILASTDGGETWSQLPSTNTPDFYYVQKIVMSKGSSQRIYAATRTGVMRTTDGGATWTKVLDGAAVNGCMDLAIQTDRALARVFAACGTFTQAAIHRALDTSSAQSWASVFSPPNMGRTSLALAPSNQNIIYAMAASNEVGATADGLLAVYRSDASGGAGTWTTRVTNTSPTTLNRHLLSNPVFANLASCGFGASNQLLNQGWYDNFIAVDPVDPNIVWAGGIDMFRSNDGGQNWGQASHWWFTKGVDPEYSHADNHGVVFHPNYNGTTNKIMFSHSDGGISMTSDARAPVSFSPDPIGPASPVCGNTAPGTVAWTSKNNGYQVTQFYHGAIYPDGSTFFGGTQDNGTLRGSVGGGDIWSEIRGGDGGYVALNPSNTNMLWAENTALSIQRSINGGTSYSSFTSGITEGGGNFLFIAPFAQDPSNASNMWIGGAFPWRTTQATAVPTVGSIWTRAGAFFGQRITSWGVSPLDSTRVYAGGGTGGGAANGRVFTTPNAQTATSTTVWTFSKPRADGNYVSSITPDPVDAGTVYATVSTFNSATGVGHVFKSTNFGATWTNIDGTGATGIPDVPALTIAVDPANNQRLYVGTDIGVFVSTDGGANWARENTGFANVIVDKLLIKNTAPRYIYAFTHGRSVFRAAMP
jgi:photosystem II stability/assembly factor-like uncharacterized protein